MPSSAIRETADVDEFVNAIRPSSVKFTVTTRGRFAASITRINLHGLWMQRGRERLPRVWHAEPSAQRKIISFLTDAGRGAVRNGREFGLGQIALHSPGRAYQHRSLGPLSWAAMSLPAADMAEVSATLAGRDLMPEQDEEIVAPPARCDGQAAAPARGGGAPCRICARSHHQAGSARGLEQALTEAMIDCIVAPDRREDTAAQLRHTAIMQRFHAVLEASESTAVYFPQLCKKIGVSARTLRVICHEHLGLSPKRYLLLRRMHLARRTLREGAPGDTSVTDVATQFGFWELGRFAVEYKSLFGESPSETLRHVS